MLDIVTSSNASFWVGFILGGGIIGTGVVTWLGVRALWRKKVDETAYKIVSLAKQAKADAESAARDIMGGGR